MAYDTTSNTHALGIGFALGVMRLTEDLAMNWIALRMLTGDRSKYLGLVFGVTFATLLMTQQVSIFMGILTRTGNQILDVRDADIWVMDNRVRYLDEAPGLQDVDLMRVRGVPGVDWAVRTYKGIVRARLEDGNTRNVRQFFWKTVNYFLSSTGIPVNFGITIALGFIVGAAVTGQTLYLFIVESLKQFGALKAMGIPNRGILRMILLQAVLVGGIGYGLGVGLTAIFFITTGNITHLAGLHKTWLALLGTGAAVAVIVVATSIVSARRVLMLEPAVVFRG